MKKFILTAAMGALFFVGLTSMVSSQADAKANNCQESCAYMIGAGLFSSQGACMSACNTCSQPSNMASYPACLCKILEEQGQLEPLGWNFGQCVTVVKR